MKFLVISGELAVLILRAAFAGRDNVRLVASVVFAALFNDCCFSHDRLF